MYFMVQCYDEVVGDECISWSNVMTSSGGRVYFMVQCYDEVVGDECISWSNVMTR